MTASPRPVHVLHVVRDGLAGGGMENGIINIANGVRPEQVRISLCALDSRQTFSERIQRPAEYHLLPKHGAGMDWTLIRRLARLLRSARVDVVHSHNWGTFPYAVLAAKWARVPVIHGEHGKNVGELGEKKRLKAWVKSALGRRVDRLVTVSRTIAEEWAAYGVPREKILWIPNGVDLQRFRPRGDRLEQRRGFGLPEHGLLLGGIGRMDVLKNYEALVVACAQLGPDYPDLRVALLGTGPCETRMRATAARLGIADRVHWLGRRPDPENFLAALDIFVLPSKTEGMSNVVLEAMASGLPVVCADLPSHREIFDAGKEGVVYSPCTAEALAETLAALCGDPSRRTSLAAAARSRAVARFSVTRMVSDYERLYGQYTGRGANTSAAVPG